MKDKERWMQLCEKAANEHDPQKLLDLVLQIDAALAEKEVRLQNASAGEAKGRQTLTGRTAYTK